MQATCPRTRRIYVNWGGIFPMSEIHRCLSLNIFYHRAFQLFCLALFIMKLSATIFLCYFSLLIAQPIGTLLYNRYSGGKEKQECTMSCCQKKQPQKQQAPKSPFGCCNSDMSNPFAQYCCCTGFIPQGQFAEVLILSNKIVLVSADKNALIPSYSSACWRPPELTV